MTASFSARTAGVRQPSPDRAAPTSLGRLAAVLFDMDGLLVDTEPLWFEAERAVLARLGGPEWTHEDQRQLIGGTLAKTVAYLRAKVADPAEPETVGRWVVETMAGLVRSRGVSLLPGAGSLLAEVAAAGVAHALVTSAEREIMTAVLAVTGLAFPVSVCGEDVVRGKPEPEPYVRAAALLGVSPERCVVLEDSPNGVRAAEAAGCVAVAVPNAPGLVYSERAGRVVVSSLRELSLERIAGLV